MTLLVISASFVDFLSLTCYWTFDAAGALRGQPACVAIGQRGVHIRTLARATLMPRNIDCV